MTAWWVAKLQLVSVVQAVLQVGRLKVSPKLALAETLKSELENCQIKVTKAANETFNVREGTHDDLALSVAIAAWLAENRSTSSGPSMVGGKRVAWSDLLMR